MGILHTKLSSRGKSKWAIENQGWQESSAFFSFLICRFPLPVQGFKEALESVPVNLVSQATKTNPSSCDLAPGGMKAFILPFEQQDCSTVLLQIRATRHQRTLPQQQVEYLFQRKCRVIPQGIRPSCGKILLWSSRCLVGMINVKVRKAFKRLKRDSRVTTGIRNS